MIWNIWVIASTIWNFLECYVDTVEHTYNIYVYINIYGTFVGNNNNPFQPSTNLSTCGSGIYIFNLRVCTEFWEDSNYVLRYVYHGFAYNPAIGFNKPYTGNTYTILRILKTKTWARTVLYYAELAIDSRPHLALADDKYIVNINYFRNICFKYSLF